MKFVLYCSLMNGNRKLDIAISDSETSKSERWNACYVVQYPSHTLERFVLTSKVFHVKQHLPKTPAADFKHINLTPRTRLY